MGPVVAVLPEIDGHRRYRVFHSADQLLDYSEDQLTVLTGEVSGDGVLASLDLGQFQARLTAARLAHPSTDHVYALRAARIQFIPFQFRPLLRLLRADQPRLLIADEVGVGKTIEAGLILKELGVRQTLERVLVVCPKALTFKWQQEMRRFDEHFEILTAERLRYCLNEAHLEGVWPAEYRRSIVHYELLRLESYLHGVDDGRRRRPGLLELDPAPAFDLVIADEAHHLRTPGTNINDAAAFLSEVSEALLLLSATPIQLGVENLYALLNLLRPDLFTDPQTLTKALEPNKFLTRAIRQLRSADVDGEARERLLRHLEDASNTEWGRSVVSLDPRFQATKRRLEEQAAVSDAERVEAARALEEVHTLAHIMNRTRRRDIGRFTVREPHTVRVDFTPAQRTAYDRLLDLRREQLRAEHDETVVRLLMDTMERQAASCLPALLDMLTAPAPSGKFEYTDDPEAQMDESTRPALSTHPLYGHPQLATVAANAAGRDPKFEQLQLIVADTLRSAGPGKVLVFSFFLHTLAYLERRLSETGARVGLVTGKVDDIDRQRLRDRFRLPRAHPDALDLLLSSEVGCEGLDYEFCDRLVNYDIPWNPMRIEQRIGRIDRFGQLADKVLIFNFVTPGTVEERVFYRCYERLGIFRESLGELEAVLGEITQELNVIALDTRLTPEQVDERTRQLTDNALRLRAETEAFEESGRELLGWDEGYTQELEEVQDTGQTITPGQLLQLVEHLLVEPDIEGSLTGPLEGTLQLRCPRAGRAALLDRLDDTSPSGDARLVQEFRRWLASDSPTLPMTVDQETAAADRQVHFLTPTHPLAGLAIRALAPHPGQILTVHLATSTSTAPPGQYVFACELWESIAVRPETRAVSVVVNRRTGEAAPDLERHLVTILGDPSTRSVKAPADDLEASSLSVRAERLRRQRLEWLMDTNDVVLARQRAALDAHHQVRQQRVAQRLSEARDPRIVRMLSAQQSRIDADYQRQRRALDSRAQVDVVAQRLATGSLEVNGGE